MTPLDDMVKYLRLAEFASREALSKCKEALEQCALARRHLDQLEDGHRELKEALE